MTRKTAWIGFAALAITTAAFALRAQGADEHWPTWRGPGLSGIASSRADPPVRWSETKNVKWKVAVAGDGSGSPVIWGDRLFLLTAVDTKKAAPGPAAKPVSGWRSRLTTGRPNTLYQFDVLCIDRKTGKTLWRKTVRTERPHEGRHPSHGYASYSPVTDGQHVWASFGSRGLHCLDFSGTVKWSKDLGRLQTPMSFGEGSSAALAGDAVIVVMDHQGDSYIAAFEKNTGKPLWRSPRDEGASWSTPLVVDVGGKTQVVVSATRRTRGYDPQTGKVIWECGGQTANVIPSPVTGLGMVFCASGRRGNALQAIELGRKGDLTGTNAVRWEIHRNTPYVPSPLLYGGRIYVYLSNTSVLSCYDARTGKPVYERQRIESMHSVYASPVGAAKRIYLAGRRGVVTVIRSAAKFEVLATNKLDDGFDASPAVIGNDLYLRGRKNLYCIAKKP